MTGREIHGRGGGAPPGRPSRARGVAQKIRDELGWGPRKPEIETMIADAWAWLEARPEGYGG